MKKFILLCAALGTLTVPAIAQKFFTRDARVQFNSDTPMEKIEAVNKSGTAVMDIQTGKMEWKVLIKNFIFEKALMQEHFNENYMESSKIPSATFKGAVSDLSSVNFGKDGTYKVKAKGTMEIHGVKKEVEIPGTITVKGGSLNIKSNFTAAVADYNIDIPGVVRDKIAKEINVTVDATLNPMK